MVWSLTFYIDIVLIHIWIVVEVWFGLVWFLIAVNVLSFRRKHLFGRRSNAADFSLQVMSSSILRKRISLTECSIVKTHC